MKLNKAWITFTFTFTLLILFTIPLPTYASVTPQPTAIDGVLNLTDWNWRQNGVLPLKGEWEFYWHALYTPEDFRTEKPMTGKELIFLPRAWNKYMLGQKKNRGQGVRHLSPSNL